MCEAIAIHPPQPRDTEPEALGDPVRSPSYYTRLDPQPKAVIAAWRLPWALGETVARIARAGHKPGNGRLLDLRKAAESLAIEIEWEEQHGR